MKMSLRIFGLILSGLLIIFVVACTRVSDERVGAYILVRVEGETGGEVEILYPPDMTGTLVLRQNKSFTMDINSVLGDKISDSGPWTSMTLEFTGDSVSYLSLVLTTKWTVLRSLNRGNTLAINPILCAFQNSGMFL